VRIKIPLPPEELKNLNLDTLPHFESQITLRISDMNYGNHLGNDSVLSLAHELRVQFLHKLDQNELSFFGAGIIMTDSAVQYRSQGLWGQSIGAQLWYIPQGKNRFDLYYRLTNQETQTDLAYIKTGQVFFDYERQKVTAPQGEQYDLYLKLLAKWNVDSLL